MKPNLGQTKDRRESHRFDVRAPLTLTQGDNEIAAYTRDLSNSGVYFCFPQSETLELDRELEFVIEMLPEITLSTRCQIRCRGRVVRIEKISTEMTGIAAMIVDYSILRETPQAS